MIRCKKTVLIAMSMVVMSTAFSTNVFAGGFCGCCVTRSEYPPLNGTDRYGVTRSECPTSTYCTCDSSEASSSTEQTNKLDISFLFNIKTGKLLVKYRGEGEMHDFSSIRVPHWDSYKNQITSIEIEEGVTKIGNNAFADCKYVTTIEIPNTVEEIGNNAFRGCKSLKKVTIPDSVTRIGKQAFAECIDLSSLTYQGNSDLDRKDVFKDCPRLRKVNVLPSYKGDTFCGKETYKGYTDTSKNSK